MNETQGRNRKFDTRSTREPFNPVLQPKEEAQMSATLRKQNGKVQTSWAAGAGKKAPTALDWALKYAELGWPVFPLKPGGKEPLGLLVPKGFKDATTDPQTIRRWWKQEPEANIGIPTGAATFDVLDVDPRNGGHGSLDQLKTNHSLPDTLVTITGGGGKHVFFRYSGRKFGGAQDVLPGIDIKSDGGYIVAPPSVHRSGCSYEWDGCEPGDTPLAERPAWLLELRSLRRKWTSASGFDVAGALAGVPEGKRDDTLFKFSCWLRRKDASRKLAETLLSIAAANCKPTFRKRKALKKVAYAYTKYKPGDKEDEAGEANDRFPIVPLSQIKPQKVKWLWYPYIPLGKITLLQGSPSSNKTFMAIDIAAKVTKGDKLPGQKVDNKPATVIFLSAEDGVADTIRPRFDTAGADVDKVHVIETSSRAFTLKDLQTIRKKLQELSPALVVIDPIQAFLGGGVDMHRANEVRTAMAGLHQLAEELGFATLCIRHLAKAKPDKAIDSGLGSVDFNALARSILLVGKVEDAKGVFVHLKSNLAKQGASLEYEVDDKGVFGWKGQSKLGSEDILAPDPTAEERSSIEDAKEFLKEALAGASLPQKDIQKQAKQQGISGATLNRAKRLLGVRSSQLREGGRVTGWQWELGDQGPKDPVEHVEKGSQSTENKGSVLVDQEGELIT